MATSFRKMHALGEIERLAKAEQARTGAPYAKAYAGVLDTPEGRRAYDAYEVERRAEAAAAPIPAAAREAALAKRALDLEIENYARARNVPLHEATEAVLATPAGRRLYDRAA
ncbi:hypothetical protein [Prosthecomicrobium pneumaticum]|uniref:Uncharacterized protein n=1 Tax=Prosthecomicrobium pneumaticum TaxID=81895 RepID=A0A7W9L3K9_9HYPH|nr:hypothetical protein [Prosthecomicrobium pneumaticum]MBB5754629.1 hypothetical protein [Prosthecomicrobium pneumaticum]